MLVADKNSNFNKRDVPVGISDFYEIVNKNYIYSDKTLLLADFMHANGKIIVIHRPRRFGKTLTLSMVHHFFAPTVKGNQTAGLFNNFKINTVNEDFVKHHQGQYPVISISFKDIKTTNIKDAKEKIAGLIANACKEHYRVLSTSANLFEADKLMLAKMMKKELTAGELEDSLRNLIEYLYQHYNKKVIVLLDEYDTPLSSAAAVEENNDFFKDISLFMTNLLSAALKDNPLVEKALMTGILRIAQNNASQNSVLSGLNNPKIYTALDEQFAEYFGMTEDEVVDLLASRHISSSQVLSGIRSWYNGYLIGSFKLYNPWSVLNCLDNNLQLKPYWVRTSDDILLKNALFYAGIQTKEKLTKLLLGGSIEGYVDEYVDLDKAKNNEAALWTLLVAAGYLQATHVQDEGTRRKCRLTIPNFEVTQAYISILSQWVEESPIKYNCSIELLLQAKIDECVQELTTNLSTLLKHANNIFIPSEQLYLEFVYALIIKLKKTQNYTITSKEENTNDTYSLTIKPKNSQTAILFKFQHIKSNLASNITAQAILEQMEKDIYSVTSTDSDDLPITEVVRMVLLVAFDTVVGVCAVNQIDHDNDKSMVVYEPSTFSSKKLKPSPISPSEFSILQQFSAIGFREDASELTNDNNSTIPFSQIPCRMFSVVEPQGKHSSHEYLQINFAKIIAYHEDAKKTVLAIQSSDNERESYNEFLTITLQASIDSLKNYLSHLSSGPLSSVFIASCKAEARTVVENITRQLKINQRLETLRPSEKILINSVLENLLEAFNITFDLLPASSKNFTKDPRLIMAEQHVLELCFADSMHQIKKALDSEPHPFHPSVFPSYSWNDGPSPMMVRKSHKAFCQAGIASVIDIEDNSVSTRILTEFVTQIDKKDFVVLFVDKTLQAKINNKDGNVVSLEFERIVTRYQNDRKSVIVALLTNDKSDIPQQLRDVVFANCYQQEYFNGMFKIILALCDKAKNKLDKIREIEQQFLKKQSTILSGTLPAETLMGYYDEVKKAEDEDKQATISDIYRVLGQNDNSRKRSIIN